MQNNQISLLDLPESILDCILKNLSPTELLTTSQVCTFLRDRCRSNHLWEKLVEKKWGRVIGEVAFKEWEWHITAAREGNMLNQNGSLGSFSGVWPNICLGSCLEDRTCLSGSSLNYSMMALYSSLETGRFWFPAQIYRIIRLSLFCQDALLSYDSETDSFQARQRHGGWRFIGRNTEWDMVRVPPLDTPPYLLHVSDSVDSLKPGDQIEIQFRSSPDMPYDWWYAEIGHVESCDENKDHCRCQYSDMLVVEFKQYSHQSQRRQILLSKKNYGEQADKICGFYGGIRKLLNDDEIETWNRLFPSPIPYMDPGTAMMGFSMPPVAAQYPLPYIS